MNWNGHASEDKFVHHLLVKNDPDFKGTYIELGTNDPIQSNNTYVFEKLGWYGVTVNNNYDGRMRFYAERANKVFICDINKVNWTNVTNDPKLSSVDYFSFDASGNLISIFDGVPWNILKPKIITLKHDTYVLGTEFRNHARKTLIGLGYDLVCNDIVCSGYGNFEDWYVLPEFFDSEVINKIRCGGRVSTNINL